MTARTEITAVLFNHFNLETNEGEFLLTHDHWYLYDEDIIVEKEFKVYIETPKISKEELALKAIETLKGKQQTILAEAYKKEQKLQEKINQLLALPNLTKV